MNSFSEAVTAAQTALKNGDLSGDFSKMKVGLSSLLGPNGPDVAHKAQLNDLREKVKTGVKKLSSKGTVGAAASAKVIIDGAGTGQGLNERAATLKMLKHLYHERSSGGQQIWVYSPPSAYAKWIFDEVQGASSGTLPVVLAKPEDEVYSETQRAVMAQAVQMARSIALNVMVKLGSGSDVTKAVVRRYFGNAATTERQLIDTMSTLAAGYQRIANACNEGNIVISDEPIDRTGGGWKDWAFIYTAETMSVIYLQGAWLKKADEVSPSNTSPLYRCARTVLHELSHKEVGTEDIVYGPKGLKPDGSTAMTPEYALHNADSWAYFAVDVLGLLTGPDKANGNTPTTAILRVPSGTLKV